MKLQPASLKEIRRMSICCVICAVLEILMFLLLHLLNITVFSYRIILSTLCGTIIAVANFSMLCIMVQRAVAADDEKLRKAVIRGSYNLRLLLQAMWIIAALIIPCFNVIAAAIPLAFPSLIIYFLQIRGRLFEEKTASDRAGSTSDDPKPDDSPEELNSFEV